MKKKSKSLMETNPYLKNPVLRKAYNLQSVISSTGVEGIKVSDSMIKAAKEAVMYAKAYKELLARGFSKEGAKETLNKLIQVGCKYKE